MRDTLGEKIQDCINAAGCDECVVYPGWYSENLVFNGAFQKLVRSANPDDPATVDATVISGGNIGGTVLFQGGNTSELRGFTIRDGKANWGGGIHMISDATVRQCTITGNTADSKGGGIQLGSANALVTDCLITGNTSLGTGGGVEINGYSGGNLSHSRVIGNSARWGGGLFAHDVNEPIAASIVNCEFRGNTATLNGGGVYFEFVRQLNPPDAYAAMQNCTIAGNSAGDQGGGLYMQYSNPKIVNSIMYFNSPANLGGFYGPYLYTSNFEGFPGAADPLFVSTEGPPSDWDLRLQPGSPCVDSGTDQRPEIVDDIAHIGRPQGVAFDIGAHERPASGIVFRKAIYDYLLMQLSVEAESPSGSLAALSVQGFGPMNWNSKKGYWTFVGTEVTGPPLAITVCGPLDGCLSLP